MPVHVNNSNKQSQFLGPPAKCSSVPLLWSRLPRQVHRAHPGLGKIETDESVGPWPPPLPAGRPPSSPLAGPPTTAGPPRPAGHRPGRGRLRNRPKRQPGDHENFKPAEPLHFEMHSNKIGWSFEVRGHLAMEAEPESLQAGVYQVWFSCFPLKASRKEAGRPPPPPLPPPTACERAPRPTRARHRWHLRCPGAGAWPGAAWPTPRRRWRCAGPPQEKRLPQSHTHTHPKPPAPSVVGGILHIPKSVSWLV